MSEIEPILPSLLIFVLPALVLLAVVIALGWLSPRRMSDSPRRDELLGWPDLLAWFGLLVVGMVMGGVALAALDLMPPPGAADEAARDPRDWAYISLIGLVLANLPLVVYFCVRIALAERGIERAGLLSRRPGRDLLVGLAGYGAAFVFVYATGTLVTLYCLLAERQTPTIAHDLLQAMQDLPWGMHRWILVLCAVIGAPVFEELIYRGLLQTTLHEMTGWRIRWLVVFITSAIFTVMHLGGVPWQALPSLFVLSIVLGYLYERTGSLWPGIVTHLLFNLTSTALVIYDLVPDAINQ